MVNDKVDYASDDDSFVQEALSTLRRDGLSSEGNGRDAVASMSRFVVRRTEKTFPDVAAFVKSSPSGVDVSDPRVASTVLSLSRKYGLSVETTTKLAKAYMSSLTRELLVRSSIQEKN